LYVFVKEKLAKDISNVEISIVKTGAMGSLGNKGSCFIRFSYLDTNFAVCCAHLSAGAEHHKERINELVNMMNKPLKDPATNKVRKTNKIKGS